MANLPQEYLKNANDIQYHVAECLYGCVMTKIVSLLVWNVPYCIARYMIPIYMYGTNIDRIENFNIVRDNLIILPRLNYGNLISVLFHLYLVVVSRIKCTEYD